jgi:23S rRNA pseudouridine955/2504/2580 synthase
VAHEFEVAPVDDGRRLDRYLEKLEGGLPGSLVRRFLRQRRVRVNGKRVRDGSLRLTGGDRIEVHAELQPPAEATDDRRWSLDAPAVLHRDDEFLVVDKPAGVACSDDGTDPFALQIWLREFLADEIRDGRARPEPCHRLDRGTTGIVVIALTPTAFDRFRRALEQGRVRKVYQVAVRGVPGEDVFSCTASLERIRDAGPAEPRMIAGNELTARTDFRVLRSAAGCTLLEARLHTGRTHQIRAHCRLLGLPVVGDPRYGDQGEPGHQMLHAAELALEGDPGWSAVAPWPGKELGQLRSLGLAP